MLDELTLKRIETLHPKVRREVLDIYCHINEKLLGKGVRLRFAYTFRTTTEQDRLYAQGRTTPGKKVTNAKAWQSVHNYGLALDIVLLLDKDGNGSFETVSWDMKADYDKDLTADWMEVVKYFKSKGWEWGGDWTSFKDYPHLQKTFGLSVSKMRERIVEGKFTVETIFGLDYKYIDL